MATFLKKKNNAESTLSTTIDDIATTITVEDFTDFPTSGDFLLTIWDDVTYPDPSDDSGMEIVKVTNVLSGTSFTIERGQEGTTPSAHTESAAVALLITVGHFTEIEDAINSLEALDTLGELTDVTISGTPADNEILGYNSGSGEWINQTAAELGLGGFTEGSTLFAGSDGLPTEDNDNFFFNNSINRLLIGLNTTFETTTGLSLLGNLDIIHTALESDDHAFEIDVDAAGFGDVKAIDIFYHTGAIDTGQDEEAILIQFDEFDALGGDLVGLEVLTTEGGADKVIGLFVGALVSPIEQLSGTFTDMDSALVNVSDERTDLINSGADTSTFILQNDIVTIGHAIKFEELEFILTTVASGGGIQPLFEFSTGVGTWESFDPADGTNGLRNNGVIVWLDSDIPGWLIGTGDEYLIRITRQRVNLNTPPVTKLVQISADLEYYWNELGNLLVNKVTIGAAPTEDFEVANKKYVDDQLLTQNELGELTDVDISGVNTGDFLQKSASDWVDFDLFGTANTFTSTQTVPLLICDDIEFTDVEGQIAGIENQNLLDKTATETITGAYTFEDKVTINDALLIDGDASEVQLRVDMNAIQGLDVMQVRTSGGTNVFAMSATGSTTFGDGSAGDSAIAWKDTGTVVYKLGFDDSETKLVLQDGSGALGTTNRLMEWDGADIKLFPSNTLRLTFADTLMTFADSYNMTFNTTTGTKIGTATSQKIGFWDKAPVVQPTVGSDTLVNLYTALRLSGIIG